jgi:hypothetical protein
MRHYTKANKGAPDGRRKLALAIFRENGNLDFKPRQECFDPNKTAVPHQPIQYSSAGTYLKPD